MDIGLSHAVGAHLAAFASCRERLRQAVQLFPDRIAIASLHQLPELYKNTSATPGVKPDQQDKYLRWTYRELDAAGSRLATALRVRGVSRGSPIFTLLPNGIEFMIVLWASSILGSTLIPLNLHQVDNTTEMDYMIRTSLGACGNHVATVIALNQHLGSQMNQLGFFAGVVKFVVDGDTDYQWRSFGEVLSEQHSIDEMSLALLESLSDQDTDSFIYFTSGTTDLPKGVHLHYPHFPAAYVAVHEAARTDMPSNSNDVYGFVLPNHHVMYLNLSMRALCTGARIVFPSAAFGANDFVAAVSKEKISHAPLVPTMVAQIVAARRALSCEWIPLSCVIMGGAGVSPDSVRSCVGELGVDGVEVIYGSTEGVCVESGFQSPEQLIRSDKVSCGMCGAGSEIKICTPGTRDPVALGQAGELHYTSVSLANGYIGRQNEELYVTDGETWMATGDQATLHSDGKLYIGGRYKEMIIRGGVNISPAAVESCIARELPHVSHLEIQVVGIDDSAAGELPVAITALPVSPAIVSEIKNAVRTQMGTHFALDDVISIQELGLERLPKTTSGKIQKLKLKQALQSHRLRLEPGSLEQPSLAEKVTEVLGRALGVDPSCLTKSTMLASVGDSISLMRFRDKITKMSGMALNLEDMAKANTVGELIETVCNQSRDNGSRAPSYVLGPNATPNMEDIVHAEGQLDRYETIRQLINKATTPHGLVWDDIREVFPLYDLTRVLSADGRLRRWDFRVAIVTNGYSVQQLRTALLSTLANNPMQSSFIIQDESMQTESLASHVVVNQQRDFLERFIEDRGSIETVAQLRDMALKGPNHPPLPGPLFRASLYYVEDAHSAGIIYNLSHAVTDASFMQIILEDLDLSLRGEALKPHVPYRLYCDSLYTLRESFAARSAIRYHAEKLRFLGSHHEYLWPPRDLGFVPEDGGPDGYLHRFSARELLSLCEANTQVTLSVVLKAATMLMVLYKTGHSHAIFSHVDAARDKFPFLPKSIATAAGLNAGDVGGQTIQVVVNLAHLHEYATVIECLTRMQEEQVAQHQHNAAPWAEIMKQLDKQSAAVFKGATAHCMFNWLGTLGESNQFDSFKVVNAAPWRTIVPFVNNVALLQGSSKEDAQIQLHVRGAVFAIEELGEIAKLIERALCWLTNPSNWTAPVSGFRAAFR